MIQVSHLKNKGWKKQAQNNHVITLIRRIPTEVTMGVRCSTEKFCGKTGDA